MSASEEDGSLEDQRLLMESASGSLVVPRPVSRAMSDREQLREDVARVIHDAQAIPEFKGKAIADWAYDSADALLAAFDITPKEKP